jgi:quercetin dioxygenase-like cupin family protein
MNLIDISHLVPPQGGSARIEGADHEANVSFFVVNCPPGFGPKRHRHPYEETIIVLDGAVEVTIGDEAAAVTAGQVAIVPPGTWHLFRNEGDTVARLVNIHPVSRMVQEEA